jgi:hypothetical protein
MTKTVATFIVILTALPAACDHTKPATKPTPLPTLPARRPYLSDPPPRLLSWKVAGRDEGCPEPFSDCLLPKDSAALSENYEALIRYSRDAWTLCGASSSTSSTPVEIAPATTP